jgi:hypothetical protein
MEEYYIIRPKPQFEELLLSHPHTSFLSGPHLWIDWRAGLSRLTKQEHIVGVKLLFLLRIFVDYGRESDSDFHLFLAALGKTDPLSVSIFDQWWTIEATDIISTTMEMQEELSSQDLDLLGLDYSKGIQNWIKGLKSIK